MPQVVVVIGAGSIGQAIVRRVSAGKLVLLADIHQQNAIAAAKNINRRRKTRCTVKGMASAMP